MENIRTRKKGMSKTTVMIINKKIAALEKALEANDYEFIGKWHGSREYAEMDLEELKARLNSRQDGMVSAESEE